MAPMSPGGAGSDPRIGTMVGSYQVDALLGRGGMGVVYRAEDQRPGTLGRKVALKILAPELSADDRFRQRFLRESQMAASIDHPNIVPVYEAGEVEGLLYIAMRYVQGEDLRALVQREGPLPPDRALGIISQVAAALDTAHARGLVHRDVKPGNILVIGAEDQDSTPHVYLTDFGLTKRSDSHSGLTVTGQFVGTIEYVAPEQIEGKEVDPRTDLYALGCVFFEVLTGTPPFQAEQEAALLWAHLSQPPPKATDRRPDLPPALDQVLAKAMAKAMDDRYGSCRELMAAARSALTAQPVPPTFTPTLAPPPPPPPAPAQPVATPAAAQGPPPPPAPWQEVGPPPGPPQKRSPVLLVSIILGVLVLAAAGLGIYLATREEGPGPTPTSPTAPPSPTPTAPSTEGPFPNPAETELLAHVPPRLQTPACTRSTAPPAGALAAVDCFTDTPQLVDYVLFADAAAMNAAYDQQVSESGIPRGSGNCATSEPSEDSWLDPEGNESGRLLCYEDGFSAIIAWTHEELLIGAETTRPGGTIKQVYNFWAGIADHV